MDKDIEILEEFVKINKGNPGVMIQEEKFNIIQAIENLIKRNKELEEINKRFENGERFSSKQMGMILEGIKQGATEAIKREMVNLIPKNKLEKIILSTPENPISLEVQSSPMYKELIKLLENKGV